MLASPNYYVVVVVNKFTTALTHLKFMQPVIDINPILRSTFSFMLFVLLVMLSRLFSYVVSVVILVCFVMLSTIVASFVTFTVCMYVEICLCKFI